MKRSSFCLHSINIYKGKNHDNMKITLYFQFKHHLELRATDESHNTRKGQANDSAKSLY